MNYQTTFEKRVRSALCWTLWCSPYLHILMYSNYAFNEAFPFYGDHFLTIFIAATLIAWALMIVAAFFSRRKHCFTDLRTRILLRTHTPFPATIVQYGKFPHSTSRPGKWTELRPIVNVNGREMVGNSFVDEAPEVGTKCEVILCKNKCWIL